MVESSAWAAMDQVRRGGAVIAMKPALSVDAAAIRRSTAAADRPPAPFSNHPGAPFE
jgi:hypothetical protein